MRLWKKPPDLTLSNEYQELTRGGCINCGAMREVLSATSYSDDHMDGCWAYEWREGQPVCLGRLKDDDPKVIQARNEIIAARQAVADAAEQRSRERAKEFRRISKRRLP
jgi:hypothetical protein